jgi:hypothetical protein
VRLNRLTDAGVRTFLADNLPGNPSASDLDARVSAAAGSIGAAIGADEESGKAYSAATQLLEAVLAGKGPALERALKQTPFAARGDFTAMLDALADTLGEAARDTLGCSTRRPVPEALKKHRDPGPLLRAMDRVADAREAASGNVNPQLLLAVLGGELAEVL